MIHLYVQNVEGVYKITASPPEEMGAVCYMIKADELEVMEVYGRRHDSRPVHKSTLSSVPFDVDPSQVSVTIPVKAKALVLKSWGQFQTVMKLLSPIVDIEDEDAEG